MAHLRDHLLLNLKAIVEYDLTERGINNIILCLIKVWARHSETHGLQL